MNRYYLSLLFVMCFSFNAADLLFAEIEEPAEYTYSVVASYPHDAQAFTQGLVYHKGHLYEGTGLKGFSQVRKVDLQSGRVLKKKSLDGKYFGEGITIIGNTLYQLTEKANKGFAYTLDSLEQKGGISYDTFGWGLTTDGRYLILSDGTSQLYFIDPESGTRVKTLKVRYGNREIRNINELEFINGEIYANIWGTDKIVIITPETGSITGIIDLNGLLSDEDKKKIGYTPPGVKPVPISLRQACLNGIAYDRNNNRLLVTGKLWPKVFEIRILIEQKKSS